MPLAFFQSMEFQSVGGFPVPFTGVAPRVKLFPRLVVFTVFLG